CLGVAQRLLNGGELDGARVMSRSTIKLMTSDHLGTRIAAPLQPGELLLGTPGYTFGLGFAVRQGDWWRVCRVPRASSCGRVTPAPTSGSIPRKRSSVST